MDNNILLRMPANLDIQAIIKNDPHSFYGQGMKKNKLIFIIDSLIRARASRRIEINETKNRFVPLSSSILKIVLYDYKVYVDFLIANNVIESDGYYLPGIKSIGYAFNPIYEGQRLKVIPVNDYMLKKGIRRAHIQRESDLKRMTRGYSYLTGWWETGLLKIDLGAAYLWIERYEKTRLASIPSVWKDKRKDDAKANIIDTTEDFKYLCWKINNLKAQYSFQGEGHRFYNPISNLKKELRQFLSYDGRPLVDVDIKNSQPFLSIALFNSTFWAERPQMPKSGLKLIDKGIYEIVKDSSYYYMHIIMYLVSSESHCGKGFDFEKYKRLVSEGKFYEYIADHFKDKYPGRFSSRSDVKREVLRILYVDPARQYDEFYLPCQTFKEHFRDVDFIFETIKLIKSNYLAIILQRIESYLMLDLVCKAVYLQSPTIPLFTIHDNILTTKGNEEFVRKTIILEAEKLIGFKPSVDCSDLIAWSPVIGYEGQYEISYSGVVRSVNRTITTAYGKRNLKGKVLKTRKNNCGYEEVRLSKDGRTKTTFVHCLLAAAFIPNPEGKMEVNHKNSIKMDNSVANLEWVTHAENMHHASKMGLCRKIYTAPVMQLGLSLKQTG